MKDEHQSNVALPLVVISLFMLAMMGGGFYLVKRFHVDTPTAATSLVSPLAPPPPTPTPIPTPTPTPIPTPTYADPLAVPTVSIGTPSVDAGSAVDVTRTVAMLRPGFRACYNKGLASDPTQSGTLTLEIEIDKSGDVVNVTKVGGLGLSADVEQCIMRRARGAAFPSGASAKIRVPVTFVKT